MRATHTQGHHAKSPHEGSAQRHRTRVTQRNGITQKWVTKVVKRVSYACSTISSRVKLQQQISLHSDFFGICLSQPCHAVSLIPILIQEVQRESREAQKSCTHLQTIFAGSGDCVAVGVIRDWEKRVVCNVQMIIGGNCNILPSQQQQIHDLDMGLKEIAAASEQIAARQFHSTHSDVLKDSPPAKTYQKKKTTYVSSIRFFFSDFPL